MIKSIRSKGLRQFAENGDTAGLPVQGAAVVERLEDQLFALNGATEPSQMASPGWRFHPLKGKPSRYSVRVTANYRLTFGFDSSGAIDVDIEDYH